MATRGSALGLGRPDLGALEPGSAADLNVYDMTSASSTSGRADLLSALLWTSPGRRPRDVAVGGRVVVQDAALLTADAQALAAALARAPGRMTAARATRSSSSAAATTG